MGKFTGMDGRAISKKAREDIVRSGVEMSVTAEYDHLPTEHRARIRTERTGTIRSTREEARWAIEEWAKVERAAAQKRLSANPVGSAAEESRRVAEELRIGRMVEAARASGNAKSTADDIAERAWKAYSSGNADEANVLARAAIELGEATTAVAIVQNIEADRILADPEKAKALRDLNDVDVVLAAFHRDINAATSQSFQDGVKLARAIGDTHAAAEMQMQASEASRTAKMAAWVGAQETGTHYAEPLGVLPGGPTDFSHPIRSTHAAQSSEGGVK